MCYACVYDPFGYIDRFTRAGKLMSKGEAELKKFEAKELKDTMTLIERSQKGSPTCDKGNDVVDAIKKRQYELAQEM